MLSNNSPTGGVQWAKIVAHCTKLTVAGNAFYVRPIGQTARVRSTNRADLIVAKAATFRKRLKNGK